MEIKLAVKIMRDTATDTSRWTVVCERNGTKHQFHGVEQTQRDARTAAAGVASLCCTSDLGLVLTEETEP